MIDRKGFDRALAAELERSRRSDEPFALVLVELDGERTANGAGDPVERVARGLVAVTRLFDVVAHVDRARFAVIAPASRSEGGCALADRLRATVSATGTRRIPVSVGVAQFPEHGASADLLQRSASLALAQASALGGDRCEEYAFDLEEIADQPTDDETPLGISELLDLRYPASVDAAQQVADHVERMAQELGLTSQHAARVRLAGLLHDVGKVGIPSTIVGRPGPLDDDQSEEVRGHPEIGARLLEDTELADLAPWIIAHHERPDGHGYPAGLTAAEIPLEAAILAVADAYVAMTSDRAYRRAIGEEAARAELERGAGTQFDARVVEAFLATLR